MPTLKVACPACGRHLQLPDDSFFGRKVKCRECRKSFVAEAESAFTDAPAPAPKAAGTDETFIGAITGSTYGAAREETPSRELSRESQTMDGEQGRLGQYVLLETLGQGSMGTVYKAIHRRLRKTVAVKVLIDELIADARALARFEREMLAVGQLSHPNILQALDAGEADGIHYLVTEFLDGTDLRKYVTSKGGQLPVHEACSLIRAASLGLQHAHDFGLVHRDIKPSNLFVTVDGQLRILDLGLARASDDVATPGDVTAAGACVGTPDYMAPEQCTNPRGVDGRADLYSLGCSLYFALTGKPPFQGDGESITGKMLAHIQSPVPNVRDVRDDVPPALSNLLLRMMAKNPAYRPASGAAIAAELEPFTRPAETTASGKPSEKEKLVEFQLAATSGKPSSVATPPTPAQEFKFELVRPGKSNPSIPVAAAAAPVSPAAQPKPAVVDSAVKSAPKPVETKPPVAAEKPSHPQRLIPAFDPDEAITIGTRKPVQAPPVDPMVYAIAGLAVTAVILMGVLGWLWFGR